MTPHLVPSMRLQNDGTREGRVNDPTTSRYAKAFSDSPEISILPILISKLVTPQSSHLLHVSCLGKTII